MSPPFSIAHYRITAKLGEGGMGEVWRATDTKLNREVAIKILPQVFAQDADRMARFAREAQVLASLNHPNIGAIYGVEERALVIELVEGPTLAERIAQGAIPPDEALPIARQIAEGLEFAHEKGVVHRDLKPANVKITAEGVVKVLDFGLAKAAEGAPSAGEDTTNSPTLTISPTRAGMILGTAAYMAPEQARGRAVDRRADIWAFGVVLYEMLAGRPAFAGETISDILAGVLRAEPDWSALPADTPPRIRNLLRRCLERDRKQRLQAIGEARIAIDTAGQQDEPASAQPDRPRLWPWRAAALIAIALAAVAAAGWWLAMQPVTRPLMRLAVKLGPDMMPAKGYGPGLLAISPDGELLAITVRGADGRVRLVTRRFDQDQFVTRAGTEGAASPFFSPDGKWIAFFAEGKLKKIAVQGGAPLALCDSPLLPNGSWGDDGNILVAAYGAPSLAHVPSAGGTLTAIGSSKGQHPQYGWPQILPRSQAALITDQGQPTLDQANIAVLSLKTGEESILHRGGYAARYLPSGHLVYVHQNTLFAAGFNLKRLEITSAPLAVLDNISGTLGSGGADFAYSQTGTFVYISGKGQSARSIFLLDSAGRTQPLHPAPGFYGTPRFSPDGSRLAFAMDNSQGGADIWVQDLGRDTTLRLTSLPGTSGFAVWTGDGRHIFFSSTGQPNPGLYWIRSDGSGEPQLLANISAWPTSLSPDGKRLALFQVRGSDLESDIVTAPIEGDPGHPQVGKPELFLRTTGFVVPAFSPDGHWLAYSSDETGTPEVYVRPFPGPGGKQRISSGGGRFPVWSRQGRELFFTTLDWRIMVAGYSAGGEGFAASQPQVWSEKRYLSRLGGGPFPTLDLTPDGKRVAVVLYPDGTAEQPVTDLTILLNFFDELRRKVP